jgi:hypothetical protein
MLGLRIFEADGSAQILVKHSKTRLEKEPS